MKKTLLVITVLLALFTTGFLAYRLGYASGRQRTLGLSQGTFTLSLAALQALSANNIPKATGYLNGQCYAHAVFLLDHPHWRDGVCVRTFIPRLVEYRREHASDASQWSPMEQTLEELLIEHGWKKQANQINGR